MIKYHGLPITPITTAVAAISGGHAFVSFANPEQLGIALECCESIACDNGAWPKHKRGEKMDSWIPYYEWLTQFQHHPAFDFAIIPDVIDGRESENVSLIEQWPLSKLKGCPVWHLNESLEFLEQLTLNWPRVALGSSGDYASIGTEKWFDRMNDAMGVLCDENGMPKTKIHGLRMLDVEIFTRFPFSSADSTNIARNIGIDSKWKSGSYMPVGKDARARIMRQRIEAYQSPAFYEKRPYLEAGFLF